MIPASARIDPQPFRVFATLSVVLLVTACAGQRDEIRDNRALLQSVMTAHGFAPYEQEWWHFTLKNEPYPDTYFDFPL